jgi:hypothetical protein
LFGLQPLTNRDAAANSFNHLLSLSTPRADAPTQLPDPPNSGFVCDDDPTVSSTATATDASTDDLRHDWRQDQQPVESSLRGFKEVSLLKALKVARGRDRPQIRKEYLTAQTRGGARHFIRKVALMSRQLRLPAPGTKKPVPPKRISGLAPKQHWQSEPLHEYRRVPAAPYQTQSPPHR